MFRDEGDQGAGDFAAEELGPQLQQKQKSLWMMKLAPGLRASDLEGLQIPLNTAPVSGTGRVPTIARFQSGRPDEPQVEYEVVPIPTAKSKQKLSQPPPGAEMPNFEVFLPLSTEERGSMARVSRPSHYFTVALAPPPGEATAPPPEAVLPVQISKEQEKKIQKTLRERKKPHLLPEHKLDGYFAPAGAKTTSQNLDAAWRKAQEQPLDSASEEHIRQILSGKEQRELRKRFTSAMGAQSAPLGEGEGEVEGEGNYQGGDGQTDAAIASQDAVMDDGAITDPAGGSFETNDPSSAFSPADPAATSETALADESSISSSKHHHRSKEHKEHKAHKEHKEHKDRKDGEKKRRRSSSSKDVSHDGVSAADKSAEDSSAKDTEQKEQKSSTKRRSSEGKEEKSNKRRSSEGKEERKSKREKKE